MNSCIAKTDKETYDDQDQFEFLTAARKWQLLKGEWEPLKILGAGTYGVVLKFKYTGSSKFMETTTFFNYSHERLLLRRRKRSIANLSFCYRSTNAKVHGCQTNTRDEEDSVKLESRHLRRLTAIKTEHIVKLYKAVQIGPGAGTSEKFDPDPGDVNDPRVYRMYLECCESGDMAGYGLAKLKEAKASFARKCVIPEEHFWRIFYCLAKGLLVMEQGSESTDPIPDPNDAIRANWRP